MNPRTNRLERYPFERLRDLLACTTPSKDREPIALSIGEPRHAPPQFIVDALESSSHLLGSYPPATGTALLRETISDAMSRRYGLSSGFVDPDRQIVPVCGTREGVFSYIQSLIDPSASPVAVMPNPFYQIYEGASLLAGAEPYFLPTTDETDYLPNLDSVPSRIWSRCQVLILCSPGNPTGACIPVSLWEQAFGLADQYGFTIAADECYADIYRDESRPPPGALEVARKTGRDQLQGLAVFHSLSKRSSVPGLRSGFVAGDPELIGALKRYRTYHGVSLPVSAQHASVVAWADADHVAANRSRYQRKFREAAEILGLVTEVRIPDGAFYLWLKVPGNDDERFAQELYAQQSLIILPGRYLSRAVHGHSAPGQGYVRISLVPEEAQCREAMERLAEFIGHYEP